MRLGILYAGFDFVSVAAFTECPLNCRVGENSPSLCPTMFSVTYTGMNFLPLCTAIVCPTNSGRIVERRDHVRTTFFSLAVFNASIFFSRWVSVNGPFFTERPMLLSLLALARHDPLVGPLVVARLETTGGLAPGRHRMASARGLAFAASVRMVHRIHGHAAIVRRLAHPAGASRFAQRYVLVIDVAHLADRRHAAFGHAANFARGQLQ